MFEKLVKLLKGKKKKTYGKIPREKYFKQQIEESNSQFPPGFDAGLMQKLIKEGYRSGAIQKPSKPKTPEAEIEEKENKRKKHKNKRKKISRKTKKEIKPAVQEKQKTQVPMQMQPENLIMEPLNPDNNSSMGILYGAPKKLVLPKNQENVKNPKKRPGIYSEGS